jgi:hypothetical protein
MEAAFPQINEHHYPIMQAMKKIGIPLPKFFSTTWEFILNTDIKKELEKEKTNISRLKNLVQEIERWSFEIDKTTLGFEASRKTLKLMKVLYARPEDIALLRTIVSIFKILHPLSLKLRLWKAQNIHFSIGKRLYSRMQERAEKKDKAAKEWVKYFDMLGNYLRVRSE